MTKFRLTLEEYDFTVNYVKGSQNVLADSLSRITIDSAELKEMCSQVNNSINVMTRVQTKRENIPQQKEINKSTKQRFDQPELVELLKRPVESVELRLLRYTSFNKKYNKINYVVYNIKIIFTSRILKLFIFAKITD